MGGLGAATQAYKLSQPQPLQPVLAAHRAAQHMSDEPKDAKDSIEEATATADQLRAANNTEIVYVEQANRHDLPKSVCTGRQAPVD